MPLGALVGSMLAERFARNGHDDANMRLVVLSSLLTLPGSILFRLCRLGHWLSPSRLTRSFAIPGLLVQ
jgi:hypothetical protein